MFSKQEGPSTLYPDEEEYSTFDLPVDDSKLQWTDLSGHQMDKAYPESNNLKLGNPRRYSFCERRFDCSQD